MKQRKTSKQPAGFAAWMQYNFTATNLQNIINKLKDIKTVKAFRIQNEKDIGPIRKYKPNAILLDGYSENQMGGTGTSFDWKIVKKLKDIHTHNSRRRADTPKRVTGYKNRKALRR